MRKRNCHNSVALFAHKNSQRARWRSSMRRRVSFFFCVRISDGRFYRCRFIHEIIMCSAMCRGEYGAKRTCSEIIPVTFGATSDVLHARCTSSLRILILNGIFGRCCCFFFTNNNSNCFSSPLNRCPFSTSWTPKIALNSMNPLTGCTSSVRRPLEWSELHFDLRMYNDTSFVVDFVVCILSWFRSETECYDQGSVGDWDCEQCHTHH